jgi:UDP-GlcNAc:undecaprenyl-phosphate GlcNAc-1-phosphate transferase
LGGYTLITFSFITLWAHFEDVTRIWPLTFLLAAGVLGFLYYNFRREAKTFMGDGGSTVIGLIASIVTARMIQVNPHVELSIGQAEQTIPAFFVFVLLFWYPLMDSLQVYTRRILRGNSPFKADRGHFHHYLMAQTSKNHLLSASIILLTTALLSLGLLVSL